MLVVDRRKKAVPVIQSFQTLEEHVLQSDRPNLDVFFRNCSFTFAELVQHIIQAMQCCPGWRQEQAGVCLPCLAQGHTSAPNTNIFGLNQQETERELFDMKTLFWLVQLEQDDDFIKGRM